MNPFARFGIALIGSSLALSSPALAQNAQDDARLRAAESRLQAAMADFQQEFDRYQSARMSYRGNDYRSAPNYRDQSYNDDRYDSDWDAARAYREDSRYQERVLSSDDRVYRGSDGRYYCQRSDGSAGLVIGGVAGGLFGNALSNRHSRTLGTLLGATVGAVAGASIDRNNSQVRCR